MRLFEIALATCTLAACGSSESVSTSQSTNQVEGGADSTSDAADTDTTEAACGAPCDATVDAASTPTPTCAAAPCSTTEMCIVLSGGPRGPDHPMGTCQPWPASCPGAHDCTCADVCGPHSTAMCLLQDDGIFECNYP